MNPFCMDFLISSGLTAFDLIINDQSYHEVLKHSTEFCFSKSELVCSKS